jgi:hypothetical protein
VVGEEHVAELEIAVTDARRERGQRGQRLGGDGDLRRVVATSASRLRCAGVS